MNHCRWNLLPTAPVDQLVNSGFSRLLTQLLYNRNITEPSKLEMFIAADERLSGDTFQLPDMEPAVTRIYQALLSGEKIAVYGDFDADGVTGTALLVKGLSSLGGNVIPYIPHRLMEGHGIKTTALENLHQQGVTLVVSVDCGITAVTEVKKAKRRGLDIIITDHHTPLSEIPSAFAVINPKLEGSNYPFSELSGVGVGYKLLQAVFQGMGKEGNLAQYIDLVALGTIADMVPLLGENRFLVKRGLESINTAPRLGVKEMMNQARINCGSVECDGISWVIAPRLNAAGRLEYAMSSYRLLMTESPDEARELSVWLEKQNNERQRLTTKALDNAREQILGRGISPILIACDSEYPAGVLGLVAGKLTEEFYRPSIVIRTGEKFCNGSCRSIPEFNIIAALNRYASLFSHFGGHSQAAGFTIATKNLDRLTDNISELAATDLVGIDLRPKLNIDAEVTFNDLGWDTYPTIQQLAPFGSGNPAPVFLTRGVQVAECRTMGNDNGHLRMKLKQRRTIWDGVGFRLGHYREEVSTPLDIVYNLELDQWSGQKKLRLNILDFAPSNTTIPI